MFVLNQNIKGGGTITTLNAFNKRTQTNDLVGGVVGADYRNWETNASNQQLAEKQNQWNIDQWNRENQYKHPQRLNDIDVLNSVKDPDLKNAMLVALTKRSDGSEIDTSGMTDDDIAETALPQNVTYGQLYDAMQDVVELQSLKQKDPPVPVPEPSQTHTE